MLGFTPTLGQSRVATNTFIGYEQMRKVKHVRCANHSVRQLAVLKVLTFIKEPTE
jgi:hypothetical protein